MVPAIRELPPPPIDGGTKPGTGENPNDTWTEITSLDGLEGTWESQYTFVEDSNGEIVSKTVVDVFTYPATGKNNVGGESEIEEISNGVKLESFIIENGERKVLYPCYYMKVDEFLKNYHPESENVTNSQIIGKVIANIAVLGFLLKILQSKVMVFVFLLFLIIRLFYNKYQYKMKIERKKKKLKI